MKITGSQPAGATGPDRYGEIVRAITAKTPSAPLESLAVTTGVVGPKTKKEDM